VSIRHEEAYIEVMLLMAMADGELQEEEATQLAFTVANRPEFGSLSERQLADAVSRATERIQQAPARQRLAELARALPTEQERFKATAFAYSILVADGIVAPGETRCLLDIQQAFGLAVPLPGDEALALRPARERRAELTRQRLLQAGRRLMAAEGFHATSSKKIAREAGVAIGSFYNYFQNKKELFLELFRDLNQRLRTRAIARTAELRLEADPHALCRGLVQMMITLLEEAQELHREKVVLRYQDADVRQLFDDETRTFAELVASTLDPHAERLRVADPETAAHILVTLLEETLSRLRLAGPLPADHPALEELTALAHRYLFHPT